MSDLAALFEELQANSKRFLGGEKGSDFEDRINAKLHQLGYSRLDKVDVDAETMKALKETVLDNQTDKGIKNPFRRDYMRQFFYQPYGSQNYPDFLVLDDDRVVSIEVKFSKKKQGKPVWNSGLPRPNGIYVFGSYGRQDITFFRGVDVVTVNEAENLHDFFDRGLRQYQGKFNEDMMRAQEYGFTAYIRKAFHQNKTANLNATLDFFTNPKRSQLEADVIRSLRL